MKKSNIISRITAIALTWMLSLLMVLLACACVISYSLGTPVFLKNKIVESNYITLSIRELREDFIGYGAAGGFEEDFMVELVDEANFSADVYAEAQGFFMSSVAGGSEAFGNESYQKMLDNATSRGFTLSADTKTAIRSLADICVADYVNYTSLSLFSYLKPIMRAVTQFGVYAIIALSVAACICAVLLFMLHKRERPALASIIEASTASAILCAVIPFVVRMLFPYAKMNLSPASLKTLLVAYVNGTLNAFFIAAAVFVVLAIVAGVRYAMLKQRRKNRTDLYS